MSYLADFHEEGGERLLILVVEKSGEVWMVAPALAETQARRAGIDNVVSWVDGLNPYEIFSRQMKERGLDQGRIAIDDETRASLLLELQNSLPSVKFVAGQPILGKLMGCKDSHEISLLKAAGAAADNALDPVLSRLKIGMPELEINEMLQAEMSRLGGQPAFCIVASGSHSAEPHHMTGKDQLKPGDILVLDFGCQVGGYKSDITRTVAVGFATEDQKAVYEIVYRAHMAARNAIRPGAIPEDVDQAARQVIEDAGYGEYFVHRTGHGLGLRIHEDPYICKGNRVPLEIGNVFSIEPGIYLPGQYGIRIENIVAVTQDGHESMNQEPSPTLRVVPVPNS